MLKVWGRATSGNVQMVMWAIAELGLAHERKDVGGSFGGTDTPDFAAMNPNRLIPVVQDGDGPFLWESAAIVRYLGARYGTPRFWPADPLARADLDKWAEWIKTTFGPAFVTGIFAALVFTPSTKRDLSAVAAATTRVGQLAGMLDARLSGTEYLGGEDVCFADIVVGTLLYRYFTIEIDRPALPHLEAYYRRLGARPAYAGHVMVSYESLRVA